MVHFTEHWTFTIMDDVLTWVSEFKLNPNEQSSASCDGMPMLMRGNIGMMTIALFINKLMETYNNASTVGKLGTRYIPPITHFWFYFQNITFTTILRCLMFGGSNFIAQTNSNALCASFCVIISSFMWFENIASRFFGNIFNEGDISNEKLYSMKYDGPENGFLTHVMRSCSTNIGFRVLTNAKYLSIDAWLLCSTIH